MTYEHVVDRTETGCVLTERAMQQCAGWDTRPSCRRKIFEEDSSDDVEIYPTAPSQG
jgi:hypothetical protein